MALDAVDAVVVVLDAASGIRTELAKLWPRVKALGLPCLVFINGLDKEGVSLEIPIAACARDLGFSLVPLSLPIGTGSHLEGVVDLVGEPPVFRGPRQPRRSRHRFLTI